MYWQIQIAENFKGHFQDLNVERKGGARMVLLAVFKVRVLITENNRELFTAFSSFRINQSIKRTPATTHAKKIALQ